MVVVNVVKITEIVDVVNVARIIGNGKCGDITGSQPDLWLGNNWFGVGFKCGEKDGFCGWCQCRENSRYFWFLTWKK